MLSIDDHELMKSEDLCTSCSKEMPIRSFNKKVSCCSCSFFPKKLVLWDKIFHQDFIKACSGDVLMTCP